LEGPAPFFFFGRPPPRGSGRAEACRERAKKRKEGKALRRETGGKGGNFFSRFACLSRCRPGKGTVQLKCAAKNISEGSHRDNKNEAEVTTEEANGGRGAMFLSGGSNTMQLPGQSEEESRTAGKKKGKRKRGEQLTTVRNGGGGFLKKGSAEEQ